MKNMLVLLMDRTISFLKEDMGIEVIDEKLEVTCPQKIKLKKNTAMIGLGGDVNSLVSIGTDDELLKKITNNFIDDEEFDIDEIQGINESMCCEIANIIIGNVLKSTDDTTINITPPILVYEAKSLFKYKNAAITTATIKTNYGEALVSIVMSSELFENELKF